MDYDVPWKGSKNLKPDKKPPTPKQISEWMNMKWNKILHFIVGSPKAGDLPEKTQDFLVQSGLMTSHRDPEDRDKEHLRISSKGYEFLLLSIHRQMWSFVQEFITDENKSEV